MEIQDAIRRPEGTCTFDYHSPDLFDKAKPGGIIFEIPSGQHLFRLERDNDFSIHFYHSSPGTGTRVATIDLNNLPPAPSMFIAFSWAPEEIKLHVGTKVSGAELTSATGVASNKQFRVGNDGHVYQIGDHGVEVMGLNIYQTGIPIIQPTAIDAWEETVKSIDILATGQSTDGYIYESVVTNLTLAILVTGFEAYTKKRFLELEQEGLSPDITAVIKSFFPKKEQKAGIEALIQSEAIDANVSELQYIVINKRTINFQSYEDCKRAYNKGYGIKFGNLSGTKLDALQSYIRYRHRIIHVSPLLGLLNQERVPPEEPVFSKKETAGIAKVCFKEFIQSLHSATLALRPDA